MRDLICGASAGLLPAPVDLVLTEVVPDVITVIEPLVPASEGEMASLEVPVIDAAIPEPKALKLADPVLLPDVLSETWKIEKGWLNAYINKEYKPVCSELQVIARTKTPDGNWGRFIRFPDHDHVVQTVWIADTELQGSPTALAQRLVKQGLKIVPNRKSWVIDLLAAWEVEERILVVNRLGWLDDPRGFLTFVLPERVITNAANSAIQFEPDATTPTIHTVRAQGTLTDWQQHIAAPACEHPMMLFALSVGLTSPFLAFVNATDSMILHLYGTTTIGKTTELQIAASPWGCAADPAFAPGTTFLQTWRQTVNGLEGQAAAHSDLLLALDEVGSTDINDIRRTVYMLSGGQGKGTMDAKRAMNPQTFWRMVVLSTGEISLNAKMADPGGNGIRSRVVHGGLTHRALDIEVSDIAANAPVAERGKIIANLKTACGKYFGTSGPEMVRLITKKFLSADALRSWLNKEIDIVTGDLAPSGAANETLRALRRFALISVAGEAAARAKLIPTTAAKVRAAVKGVVDQWLTATAETDDDRILARLRDFILCNGSQFQDIYDGCVATDRVGWVDAKNDHWIFTDETLARAVPGYALSTVVQTLRRHNLLFINDSGKLKARVTIKALKKRPGMYTVKAGILVNDASSTADSDRDNRDSGDATA